MKCPPDQPATDSLGLPPGRYRIRVSKDGFIPVELEIVVGTLGGPSTNIVLNPG